MSGTTVALIELAVFTVGVGLIVSYVLHAEETTEHFESEKKRDHSKS